MEIATKGNLTGETTHQVLISYYRLHKCNYSSKSCGSVSCCRLWESFIVKHQHLLSVDVVCSDVCVSRCDPPVCDITMWAASHLCTKLTVPSMGSMIQVGLSVSSRRSPAATDSSPMNLRVTDQSSNNSTSYLLTSCLLSPGRF